MALDDFSADTIAQNETEKAHIKIIVIVKFLKL